MEFLFTSEQMLEWTLIALSLLGVVYVISGIDDAFIDFRAWYYRLRPESFKLAQLAFKKEKRIAVMVPAWKEACVIDRMISGNIARVEYKNYDFFIGVYPNDTETCEKARLLEDAYPNVHAAVNEKEGPTTKGQNLNCMIQTILRYEKLNDVEFAAFHMQDSEDMLHPQILQLVNRKLDDADFIQTPVFSHEKRPTSLVGGIYADEFAESHSKDMCVRAHLGASVPSAGVGTCFSKKLALTFIKEYGQVFADDSLVEDYELGLRAHALNLKSTFALAEIEEREAVDQRIIGTYELFPSKFKASVRQKTRWTMGIAIQGTRRLGWSVQGVDKYFLFRDRKGLVTNLAALAGYPLFALALVLSFLVEDPNAIYAQNNFAQVIAAANIVLMTNRFFQRTFFAARMQGWKFAAGVLLRWPVGILINAMATIGAIRNDQKIQTKQAKLEWDKTDHEMPLEFGRQFVVEPTKSISVESQA